jgi:hypothetical protein
MRVCCLHARLVACRLLDPLKRLELTPVGSNKHARMQVTLERVVPVHGSYASNPGGSIGK